MGSWLQQQKYGALCIGELVETAPNRPSHLPYIMRSALVRDVDLPTGGVNIVRAKLPPPPLAGNVTLALNSVAEFTKTKDNKSSCQAV